MIQIYIFSSIDENMPEKITSREISLCTYNLQLLCITYVVLPNLAISLLLSNIFSTFIMSFFILFIVLSIMALYNNLISSNLNI